MGAATFRRPPAEVSEAWHAAATSFEVVRFTGLDQPCDLFGNLAIDAARDDNLRLLMVASSARGSH